MRSRPIVGIELLTGFVADGPGKWSGGHIYHPEDGKTYRCKLTLQGERDAEGARLCRSIDLRADPDMAAPALTERLLTPRTWSGRRRPARSRANCSC